MSGLTITTAPANEPLDAAETISYLRIDSGVDTTLIDNLIQAARFGQRIIQIGPLTTTLPCHWMPLVRLMCL